MSFTQRNQLETGKNLSMSKRRATSTSSESNDSEEEMEQVKKLEKRVGGGGSGETRKEHVLFRGDAVFVTEMNVVCLSGPVTAGGEERIIVTLKMNGGVPVKKEMHYVIGKRVKLGFLMKDYCDRNGYVKSKFRFVVSRINKLVAEDRTPDELGLRDGDVIEACLMFKKG